MSGDLKFNDDLLMLDESCERCGYLLHYLRASGELICIPTESDAVDARDVDDDVEVVDVDVHTADDE